MIGRETILRSAENVVRYLAALTVNVLLMANFPIRIPRCKTSTILPILFQYIYEVFKGNDTEENTELGCIMSNL